MTDAIVNSLAVAHCASVAFTITTDESGHRNVNYELDGSCVSPLLFERSRQCLECPECSGVEGQLKLTSMYKNSHLGTYVKALATWVFLVNMFFSLFHIHTLKSAKAKRKK